jgi:hypothetical protein
MNHRATVPMALAIIITSWASDLRPGAEKPAPALRRVLCWDALGTLLRRQALAAPPTCCFYQ